MKISTLRAKWAKDWTIAKKGEIWSKSLLMTRKLFNHSFFRYQKATRKLHATHNEYILMLCEASEFERDLRTILLPGLLEYQQAVQEDMIDKWKLILKDAVDACNRCSNHFVEMQNKIDEAVNAIRAADEYSLFTEKYKTNPPEPMVFKFDDSLYDGKLIMKNSSKSQFSIYFFLFFRLCSRIIA